MILKKLFTICLIVSVVLGQNKSENNPHGKDHDLYFNKLAKSWDEGIPIGNGILGAIVWQKENKLRIALDRADLWELRAVDELNKPEFKFSWVIDQVNKNNYSIVQKYFDEPYDKLAYPTKIPAAAIEFELNGFEKLESVHLSLKDALCQVKWKNGITLQTFVHANKELGWFKLDGIDETIKPKISTPPYSSVKNSNSNSISGPEGNDLSRLGYPPPVIKEMKDEIIYHQECSEGIFYDVIIKWKYENKSLIGWWTVKTSKPYSLDYRKKENKAEIISQKEYLNNFKEHSRWWENFWSKSSIKIPDKILENQYYRELYKFGSASRKGAPPITLQAVWTADNQKLPPWKGDFHNDLNTQLSYWPSYSANHLEEASAFTDWLWACRDIAKDYTKKYFGTDGLNFPGVSTLTGAPMGGWIQYSFGPTVSVWLAHHFYLQWRYSMDKNFLEMRAYPWIKDAALFIDKISELDSNGKKKLPLSSSPEINDNKINAWFKQTTNYDLSLIRWLYKAAIEMASEQKLVNDVAKWNSILESWPELATSKDNKLLVAPDYELQFSHRHFSHLMAIHPLGLLNWDGSEKEKQIIVSSLNDLEKLGTDWWCGYSFAWLGNMYARASMGEKAAEALKIFSTCFCLPNSFHVNGDQTKSGKSKFTYRPFTLEGNFAFASGIQEMLLQSQNGLIKIFPAIPAEWKDISFNQLRAEGAYVISAEMKDKRIVSVKIFSERGGKIKIKNPFQGNFLLNGKNGLQFVTKNNTIVYDAKKEEVIILK
jgi:alpha-L-fucosidase 2